MLFLKIPYRDYPKKGLFKKLYRENIYKIEEFKDEFKSPSFKVRDLTVFVDNGIVEVTADCDTMLGVYEV